MDLFCEKRIRHTLDELVHLIRLLYSGNYPWLSQCAGLRTRWRFDSM